MNLTRDTKRDRNDARTACVPAVQYTCCYGSTVVCLAGYRARRAWRAAAEHLNAAGLAAAVPAEVAPYLLALGLIVWVAQQSAAERDAVAS